MLAGFHIALAFGCNALPDIRYETERMRIATAFDEAVCEGTLAAFDEHVDAVEKELGRPRNDDPIVVYWLDDVTEHCGENRTGCFFPGTRVLFSTGRSITHEVVHAVLDSTSHTYFVEEGLAEIYSGDDVWHRPDPEHGRPIDNLHLSKEAYRAGKLDYSGAAHFMRYVHDRKGAFGMRALAKDVAEGGSTSALEATLVGLFDQSVDEIQRDYFQRARVYYPGFAAAEVERAEALWAGVEVRLRCGDDGTRGPLGEHGGLYTVRAFEAELDGVSHIEVSGDAGGWVRFMRPAAGHGFVTNWTMPIEDIDPQAFELRAGESIDRRLGRGEWLAIFGADSDHTDVGFTLRTQQPAGPAQEGS